MECVYIYHRTMLLMSMETTIFSEQFRKQPNPDTMKVPSYLQSHYKWDVFLV